MKKYLIIGSLGLILTALLGWYLFKFQYGYFVDMDNDSILEILPAQFQQIMYTRYDKNVENFMGQIYAGGMPVEQKNFFDLVDEFVLCQYQTGDQVMNFVVFKTNSGVSENTVRSLTIFNSGFNYKLQNYSNSIYLYGDDGSLGFIKNHSADLFVNIPKFSEYMKELKNKNANMAFFTDMSGAQFSEASLTFGDYYKHIQYGVLMGAVGDNDYKGQFDILLDREFDAFNNYVFHSKLEKYIGKDSYAAMEIGNIIDFLGLKKEDLQAAVNGLITEFGSSMSQLLTQSDYEKIVNALNGNVGIIISNADNVFNVGGTVFIENGDIFDVVNKLSPMIKEKLDQSLFSGNVSMYNSGDSVAVIFDQLFQGAPIQGKVEMLKEDGMAILKIFDPILKSGENNIALTYNDKTLFYFYINIGKVYDEFSKYSVLLGEQGTFVFQNLDYFRGKLMVGRMDLAKDKISFIFNLYSNDQE